MYKKIFPAVQKAAVLCAVLLLGASAAAQTPLERHLKARGSEIPNVIDYGDFYKAALDDGIVDIEKMLAENNIAIVGEGDRRYLRRADLLRACGKECSYHMGWGIFLSNFAVQIHRK